MKQIFCHGVSIDSNIDFGFALRSFVCNLIGYSVLQTFIKTVEHMFWLLMIKWRDYFCISCEQSQKNVDFIILVCGGCKHIVVVAILVNFILERHRLCQLDIFDPRVNSKCPVQLLSIWIISDYMKFTVVTMSSIIELLFPTFVQFAPLENLIYWIIVQNFTLQSINLPNKHLIIEFINSYKAINTVLLVADTAEIVSSSSQHLYLYSKVQNKRLRSARNCIVLVIKDVVLQFLFLNIGQIVGCLFHVNVIFGSDTHWHLKCRFIFERVDFYVNYAYEFVLLAQLGC
jgi:hypothetical protein